MGHTLKAFIIIKKPSYLLKINKRKNKKYLCSTPVLAYLHFRNTFFSLMIIF